MQMREIKFRAWDGKLMHTVLELSWSRGGLTFYGPGVGKGVVEASPEFDWVVDTVLMQYTGRKDKNGKEIYEGDIVQWCECEPNIEWCGTVSGEIEWQDSGFWLRCKQANGFSGGLWGIGPLEIIGNIHENPELLSTKVSV
jgi:uncharacterized phage protein (TIGR01671 family)